MSDTKKMAVVSLLVEKEFIEDIRKMNLSLQKN